MVFRNADPRYRFDVNAEYDVPEAEIRLIVSAIALTWHHHVGRPRVFNVVIRKGRARVTPETPIGVQASFEWEPEVFEVWPGAIQGFARAEEVSYPAMLFMYSAHESMHAVQKYRGEAPFASRDAHGRLVRGYFQHPAEREAREAGLHALKYLEPKLSGELRLDDGTSERIPDQSMFNAMPKDLEIYVTIP